MSGPQKFIAQEAVGIAVHRFLINEYCRDESVRRRVALIFKEYFCSLEFEFESFQDLCIRPVYVELYRYDKRIAYELLLNHMIRSSQTYYDRYYECAPYFAIGETRGELKLIIDDILFSDTSRMPFPAGGVKRDCDTYPLKTHVSYEMIYYICAFFYGDDVRTTQEIINYLNSQYNLSLDISPSDKEWNKDIYPFKRMAQIYIDSLPESQCCNDTGFHVRENRSSSWTWRLG
jgi:hypothetical protein